MKLIMFTPTIKTSVVGQIASLVTHALMAQGHQVMIVRTEAVSLLKEPTHDFNTNMVSWGQTKQVIRVTADADAFIYQVGDNMALHEGVLAWLPRCPGIVCLHDASLCHLFYAWAQTHQHDAEVALRHWYGDTLTQRFLTYDDPEVLFQEMQHLISLTEWTCQMATGVITHNSIEIARILSTCAGPIYTVPLAEDLSRLDSQNYADLLIQMVNATNTVQAIVAAIDDVVTQLKRWGATPPLIALEETVAPLTLFGGLQGCQETLCVKNQKEKGT